MATTETAKLGLSKQDAGNANWDVLERQDRDRLEARLAAGYAGDPNGLVAGYWLGQHCFDETNGISYICTTATGVAGTTVWDMDTDILGISAFALTLLNDANAAAMQTTLGLVIGTDVLAPDGDGSALTGISAGALSGQCQLAYVGSTSIKLSQHNGDKLIIDGTAETVPSAGVTLANTGLTAATLYYIYAYMVSTTLTLEASATGHSTHTDGVEIKTGDSTRTLVGVVYMGAGTPGIFIDSVTQRFVRSFFNRKQVLCEAQFTVDRSTSSTTLVEIHTEARNEYIIWADEIPTTSLIGSLQISSVSKTGAIQVNFDGVASDIFMQTQQGSATSGFRDSIQLSRSAELTEGYHYSTLFAKTETGTVTVTGVVTAQSAKTTVQTRIG